MSTNSEERKWGCKMRSKSIESTKINQLGHEDLILLSRFFFDNNRPDITRNFHPFDLSEKTAKIITCTIHLDNYFGAFCKNRIIGFGMLRGWDDGFDVPSLGILVDHLHQRKGIGRLLTNYAISLAKSKRCKKIRLSVYEDNFPAMALYSSIGFSELERKKIQINDETRNEIIMEMQLKKPIFNKKQYE